MQCLKMSAVTMLTLTFLPSAFAGTFKIESQSLFSARKGDDLKTDLPMYEFVLGSYESATQDVRLNADLEFFANPLDEKGKINVNTLDFSYRLIPDHVEITAGRSFFYHQVVDSSLADAVSLDVFFLQRQIQASLYGGLERELIRGELESRSRMAGASFGFQTLDSRPWLTRAKYEFRSFDRPADSEEHLLGFTLTKSWESFLEPELHWNTEAYFSPMKLREVSGAVNLYPSMKTVLTVGGLMHTRRLTDGLEVPLSSIFTSGKIYEGNGTWAQLISKNLTLSLGAAYTDFTFEDGLRARGFRGEGGLALRVSIWRLQNKLYGFKSYGGWLIGNSATLEQVLTPKWSLVEGADVGYYEKITSSKQTIVSTLVKSVFRFTDRLILDLGGEFNTNNVLRYDLRFVGKLSYLFWKDV